MAEQFDNPLIERVIRQGHLKHENGKLYIWGLPVLMTAVYVNLFLYKLIEHKVGKEITKTIFYSLGRFQAKYGTRILAERFGYKEKLQDFKKLLDQTLFNTSLLGFGNFKIKLFDFEKKLFVVAGASSIAEEFKKFFKNKEHIDHYLRGGLAGIFEELSREKYFCLETKCIANGDLACEFVLKPLDKFDKNDGLFKQQFCEEISDMREIGANIEVYITPSK